MTSCFHKLIPSFQESTKWGRVLLIAAFLSTLDQDVCMNATLVLLQEGHSAAPCFYSSPDWRTHSKNSRSSKWLTATKTPLDWGFLRCRRGKIHFVQF